MREKQSSRIGKRGLKVCSPHLHRVTSVVEVDDDYLHSGAGPVVRRPSLLALRFQEERRQRARADAAWSARPAEKMLTGERAAVTEIPVGQVRFS